MGFWTNTSSSFADRPFRSSISLKERNIPEDGRRISNQAKQKKPGGKYTILDDRFQRSLQFSELMRAVHERHLPLDVRSNCIRQRRLGLIGPGLLVFRRGQLLGIGQVVDSDGQEDVEKNIITKDEQNYKVDTEQITKALK